MKIIKLAQALSPNHPFNKHPLCPQCRVAMNLHGMAKCSQPECREADLFKCEQCGKIEEYGKLH
jgi:hypothetical protein